MLYFAITAPKIHAEPDNEALNEMNSVVSQYANGCFMPSAVAQSSLINSLISSKLMSLGEGQSPIEAITCCLKKCVFELPADSDRTLHICKDDECCGIISPKKPFTIGDLSIHPLEDVACVCLDLLRNNLIELVKIK